MLCKPAKYGVKIYWICDAENGYALKGLLYSSRSSEQRQTRLSNTIVEQWAQPFVQSNRNVFMDRYFTSDSIVQHLLERGLTAVGTVYANRRDHNKKVIMISYIPRKNKNVFLMSTCHTTLKIDNHRDDRRPNITNDYNLGKGGMGSMDYKKRRFFLQTKDQ
ncbi:PiggyBac transposable element-derived protein 4 [Trichinella spiralis]|uniref:PiggyBac transposable element-derived protein 4 n=1 Tax=Trichinella spiralis TaxID=6334 RepID=A0A0V1APS8_TRISP|nr:PiggyBac transposable element-derived protein 4 [Trichinella spiralis]